MSPVAVLPAGPGRFDDVEHALTGGGDGASCQCQWWTLTNADYSRSTREERAELMRAETLAATPPGLVAQIDGETAGWVRVGPRTLLPRLSRTRIYAAHSSEPWDDETVWAVSCFSVRREFRRQGVARTLLTHAIDFARGHGARLLEAYPVDTDVTDASTNELYRGALRTFRGAGFVETARARADRPIVALALT
ncbi:GNAT family N-acetyltransferase [Microbacterium sp. cx-55]|uniref:GNAT family N-acetyltransferase n=1 Tax=unclassified Microbacterium TaxID=2609290 RepID=UPI001CC19856|nr:MULTISPECIES: GNAT family N-acetyltransferase [unclassified Microbacterium]MBZ4486780.1 GNAT family N-acetyltransferase [Microbacterium sp. cx-55]MCC4907801.1 GNAT family N-acetyltransferase [Microbacterium sp. cx-59]UGB36264.1 GNAT family N-acetyltransferase [Microbacterium sp. cx-55]